MLGRTPGLIGLWHAIYLLAWCAFGWWLAHSRFRRRLVI
jgi:lipooligosaccharide transport system permease protein